MTKTALRIVPCLQDNYSYLLSEPTSKNCLIVDACEFSPIHSKIEEKNLKPVALLLTHGHSDHVGGLSKLKEHYPTLKVIAHPSLADQIPTVDQGIGDGEVISIGDFKVKSIHTPCHTAADVSFYVAEEFLFSGDTLFLAGCGRFFEGTGKDMYASLLKIKELPIDTKICCGHEYTKSNLEFALSLEPQNKRINEELVNCKKLLEEGESTVPGKLKTELQTNPFLRWDDAKIQSLLRDKLKSESSPEEVITLLREMKNSF